MDRLNLASHCHLAISSVLEDPRDQNSDAARELQSLGRETVAEATTYC